VMRVGGLDVDLAEPCHLVGDFEDRRQQQPTEAALLYVPLESDFRPRKDADRNVWLADTNKPVTCRGLKRRRFQLVADIGGPGFNVSEAIVANDTYSSSLWRLPRLTPFRRRPPWLSLLAYVTSAVQPSLGFGVRNILSLRAEK
jgi:hypothetical protein